VIQDWGSALGFDWAYRHQDRVAGLAFMEFIAPFPTWNDPMQEPAQEMFKAFRDPASGRKLIIEQNIFVDVLLPGGSVRTLTSCTHGDVCPRYALLSEQLANDEGRKQIGLSTLWG
jgi:haloalkane dehalogenase